MVLSTWLILLPKETKLLTLFPFMLLLQFHEMVFPLFFFIALSLSLFPTWNVVSCFKTVETNYLKLCKNMIIKDTRFTLVLVWRKIFAPYSVPVFLFFFSVIKCVLVASPGFVKVCI